MLGFIDVPGHERLVHTMVAGAGGIDFALLVIAADDGVMPQTREHLAILELLGITHGAVALTKIDRVDDARIRAVTAQIRALLAPDAAARCAAFPARSPRVPDDPGVAALRAHLAARWRQSWPRRPRRRPVSSGGRSCLYAAGTRHGGDRYGASRAVCRSATRSP